MKLDSLVTALRAEYGDDLRAVVLYGSAAMGQHIERRSDYNVLVVVDRLPLEALERVAKHSRSWIDAGNPPPLTLTTAEWKASADIFAMEYSDILASHKVLHGTLPLEHIQVDRDHLRLQVEHEAMGNLLRLRQGVEAARADPARELILLEQSLSTFTAVFRGAIRLHGEEPPAEQESVSRVLASRAGFDPAPFVRIGQHKRGIVKVKKSEVRELLAGYLAGIEALVGYLNRYAAAV